MTKGKVVQKFPTGWNESRVRRVLNYYESQTDEGAASEIESGLANTTMQVPTSLVPVVRELIAKRKVARARAIKRHVSPSKSASRARRG
jgi:hypothetical protein